MKNCVLIITIFFNFSFSYAQNEGPKGEKIQALKIAFITQKLNLTADEAQKFWPVYNQYEKEVRQTVKENKNTGDPLDNEEKILNIKRKYRQEFIKTVGQPKTNTLFNAEKEFRGVLMRQLKNRQAQMLRQ
ncbi:MAG: hypothetical protein M3004_11835 [Bacteroidota bacterium]|nr:hypothetical protein [Bacteroidota bacterium]